MKRLIIAYDKFPAIDGKKENLDPSIDFLIALIKSFKDKGWLMNVEDQFFYSLNTTLEVEFPEFVNDDQRNAHAEEVFLKLNQFANTKVSYGILYGNPNPGLNRAKFYETVNGIIQGGIK